MLFPKHRAYATVDTAAVAANFCLLRQHARQYDPTLRTIAVVKADAYGHGAPLVIPALQGAGCDFFAVATPDEGLEARRLAPGADILVLGYTPPDRIPELVACGITQTVFSTPYARAVAAAVPKGERLAVHIKIDGGMCRQGFAPTEVAAVHALLGLSGLRVTGLYTHFPVADSDPFTTLQGWRQVCALYDRLPQNGLLLHGAATAAMLQCPDTLQGGARPGLGLYGLSPVATSLPLRPALRLWAPVVQIRQVPAGTPVGYGGDFVTKRRSRIGLLPIGYADGLRRALGALPLTLHTESGRFSTPIVGRICMDHTMIDLTDTPAGIGDPVLIFDDVCRIARLLGTIPYEVLTSISRRVTRQKLTPDKEDV